MYALDKLAKWIKLKTGTDRSGSYQLPVTVEEWTTHDEPEIDVQLKPVDGRAAVVNGSIIVTDPENFGSFPVVVVPKNEDVVVEVNQNRASGEFIVASASDVQVRFINRPAVVKYSFSVSEDKLEVIGRKDVKPGVKYRLLDCEPTRKLILQTEVEPVDPEYDHTDIRRIAETLSEQGFVGNFDLEGVQELCRATKTCTKVIMRGRKPIPGRPGQFTRVNIATENDPYLGRVTLGTVTTGACIAVYEPDIAGQPGRDVYGNEIPVHPASSKPELGSGVVEVNGNIVATRAGRVLFTKRFVDVAPERIIDHDVTVKDGKVWFDGNIVVKGDLTDGTYIRCTGTVTVCGCVFQSTVIGEKGVRIAGNILNSTIWGGYTKIVYTQLTDVFKRLMTGLNEFYKEYTVMFEHSQYKVNARLLIPKIAKVLFEQRHQHLGQLLQSAVADCSPDLMEIDSKYREVVELLRSKWQGVQRTNITKADIEHLLDLLEEYLRRMDSAMSAEPAPITAHSATSSAIRATGNIMIKTGAFASSVESGGSITVSGIARGGFIVANKIVRVRELGSMGSGETSVKVKSADGMIFAGTVHANTLLEIGGQRSRNFVTERNIKYGREHLELTSIPNR